MGDEQKFVHVTQIPDVPGGGGIYTPLPRDALSRSIHNLLRDVALTLEHGERADSGDLGGYRIHYIPGFRQLMDESSPTRLRAEVFETAIRMRFGIYPAADHWGDDAMVTAWVRDPCRVDLAARKGDGHG